MGIIKKNSNIICLARKTKCLVFVYEKENMEIQYINFIIIFQNTRKMYPLVIVTFKYIFV